MCAAENDNQALPLDPAKIKTIAVIGANAKAKFAHQGNSATIKTRYEITPFEGITTRAGDAIKINYAEGYRFTKPRGGKRGLGGAVTTTDPTEAASTPELIAEAVDAAKNADVAVVVAGLYRSQDQEGADRPNMNLPPGQAELIAAVANANPKTIVILTGGSPSVVDPWINDAAGLIMYWYGGTEGGNALAHVLFGDINPSGHLPCTWPKQLTDSPAHAAANKNQYPGINTNWHGDETKLTPTPARRKPTPREFSLGIVGTMQKTLSRSFPSDSACPTRPSTFLICRYPLAINRSPPSKQP